MLVCKSFRVEQDLYRQIKTKAAHQGQYVGDYIAEVLRQHLTKLEKSEPKREQEV